MSSTDLSLIQKFNEAKKRLAEAKLNKSGHNTYSKYDYFELGDFLPTIIKAESELNFLNLVTFPVVDGIEFVRLTACDGTSDKTLTFESKTADVEMKGMVPIQGIGAKHTYMRRYVYVMAYEISEHDAIDEGGVKEKPEVKPDTSKNVRPRPEAAPKPEPKPIDDKTAVATRIFKLMYPDAKDATKEGRGVPNGFNWEIYSTELSAYNKLDKTVKGLSNLNVDQLKDMEQKMQPPK